MSSDEWQRRQLEQMKQELQRKPMTTTNNKPGESAMRAAKAYLFRPPHISEMQMESEPHFLELAQIIQAAINQSIIESEMGDVGELRSSIEGLLKIVAGKYSSQAEVDTILANARKALRLGDQC